MLKCERCGTSFSEVRGGSLASCPRCRVRDGVSAPLVGRRTDTGSPATARVAGTEPGRYGAAEVRPQRR
jgi:hypothetical protein